MKAYAIGRRAKWKDYVDLYMIINQGLSVAFIAQNARTIFGDAFSEKLFRQQLAWHQEMDYSEPVDWLLPMPDEETIKQQLIKWAMF